MRCRRLWASARIICFPEGSALGEGAGSLATGRRWVVAKWESLLFSICPRCPPGHWPRSSPVAGAPDVHICVTTGCQQSIRLGPHQGLRLPLPEQGVGNAPARRGTSGQLHGDPPPRTGSRSAPRRDPQGCIPGGARPTRCGKRHHVVSPKRDSICPTPAAVTLRTTRCGPRARLWGTRQWRGSQAGKWAPAPCAGLLMGRHHAGALWGQEGG